MDINKEGDLEIQIKNKSSSSFQMHRFILKKDVLEWTIISLESPVGRRKRESKAPSMENSFNLIGAYLQSNSKLGANVFILRSDKGKDLIIRSVDTKQKEEWVSILRRAGVKEAAFVQSTYSLFFLFYFLFYFSFFLFCV
jgi:hypothetical protein